MSRHSKSSGLLEWTPWVNVGPQMAYHVGAVIGRRFFVHGGIALKGSKDPLNNLFYLNLDTLNWIQVVAEGSPNLSHHCCVVMQNRYLVLIGGWNGRARTSDVHIYDTEGESWKQVNTVGFPKGAGLSSHSALLTTPNSVLIIGREGGLRTQRRSGNAFILKGNPEKDTFTYVEHPIQMSSRSGHTSTIVSDKLVIIGGRSGQDFVEIHVGHHAPFASKSPRDRVIEKIMGTDTCQQPVARKGHVAVKLGAGILIQGGLKMGETTALPVGEMFYFKVNTLEWHMLPWWAPQRAGHVAGVTQRELIIHGGEGAIGIHNDTYRAMID